MGKAMRIEYSKDMGGQELLHLFRYHLACGFVNREDTVADFGCGTGYGSSKLAHFAKHVTGFDITNDDIVAARERYGRDGLTFVVADLEKHVFDEKFDVSVMFEVIEHLYKPVDFAKKLKEITKKFIIMSIPFGGKLIFDEETKEYHEFNDTSHKSVFESPNALDDIIVDDNWKKFFSFVSGITYCVVYYNREAMP